VFPFFPPIQRGYFSRTSRQGIQGGGVGGSGFIPLGGGSAPVRPRGAAPSRGAPPPPHPGDWGRTPRVHSDGLPVDVSHGAAGPVFRVWTTPPPETRWEDPPGRVRCVCMCACVCVCVCAHNDAPLNNPSGGHMAHRGDVGWGSPPICTRTVSEAPPPLPQWPRASDSPAVDRSASRPRPLVHTIHNPNLF